MDTITHMLADGSTITATEPTPGLRVYPVDPEKSSFDCTWVVGHHSGYALAGCDARIDAEQVAAEIADFTDWTRTATELRDDRSLSRNALRNRINHRTPGVFLYGQPIPKSPTTFTDADIERAAEHYEDDDTDGLAIISGMAINEPFMHFDTETFNEAFDQVMRIVHPEHYAA